MWVAQHSTLVHPHKGRSAHFLPSCLCMLLSLWNYNNITESVRLGKTSKIIESNHGSTTPMPTKPCPYLPYPPFSWKLPGMVTPPLPGQPVPMHYHSSILPNIQPESFLAQLKAFTSHPITSWEKKPTATSLQPPFCTSMHPSVHPAEVFCFAYLPHTSAYQQCHIGTLPFPSAKPCSAEPIPLYATLSWPGALNSTNACEGSKWSSCAVRHFHSSSTTLWIQTQRMGCCCIHVSHTPHNSLRCRFHYWVKCTCPSDSNWDFSSHLLINKYSIIKPHSNIINSLCGDWSWHFSHGYYMLEEICAAQSNLFHIQTSTQTQTKSSSNE